MYTYKVRTYSKNTPAIGWWYNIYKGEKLIHNSSLFGGVYKTKEKAVLEALSNIQYRKIFRVKDEE